MVLTLPKIKRSLKDCISFHILANRRYTDMLHKVGRVRGNILGVNPENDCEHFARTREFFHWHGDIVTGVKTQIEA